MLAAQSILAVSTCNSAVMGQKISGQPNSDHDADHGDDENPDAPGVFTWAALGLLALVLIALAWWLL